jgi:hypothetical protein
MPTDFAVMGIRRRADSGIGDNAHALNTGMVRRGLRRAPWRARRQWRRVVTGARQGGVRSDGQLPGP